MPDPIRIITTIALLLAFAMIIDVLFFGFFFTSMAEILS
jgi:hypothetical protein